MTNNPVRANYVTYMSATLYPEPRCMQRENVTKNDKKQKQKRDFGDRKSGEKQEV